MFKAVVIGAAALVSIVFTVTLVNKVRVSPTPVLKAERKQRMQDKAPGQLAAIANLAVDVSEVEPLDPEKSANHYLLNSIFDSQRNPEMRFEFFPDTYGVVTCRVEFSEKYYRVWSMHVTVTGRSYSYGNFKSGVPYIIYYEDGKPEDHREVEGEINLDQVFLCPDFLRPRAR